MNPRRKRIILVSLVALVVAAMALSFGTEALSFDYLRSHLKTLRADYQESPFLFSLVFFVLYMGMAAFSLPGTLLLNIFGGAVFGLLNATVLASFANSIGATLAFAASRFLLRETIERHWGARLKSITHGFDREGILYLLTLRLVPIFPFVLVNLAMGITQMSTLRFYLITQASMLPGIVLYVNAGNAIESLKRPGDVATPTFLISMVVLGVLPLLVKHVSRALRLRRDDAQI